MAKGSRRSSPTLFSAAAVPSEATFEAMKTPCAHDMASVTSGTALARRPPNRMASIGTPAGSSHSCAITGHWPAGAAKRAFGWAAARGLLGRSGLDAGRGLLLSDPLRCVHTVGMRFARAYKHFTLTLLKFSHDRYSGTEIPKNFSSRIKLDTPGGQDDREVLVYMNNPLRYSGFTFYQASFEPGNDKVTVLQVVRNPSWLIPYIACSVMVGILLIGICRTGTIIEWIHDVITITV